MANTDGRTASGVSADEVARFNRLAATWWDPAGPMRALHAMNPLRVGWIDARLPPGARLLDIGCGAGLAAEALARAGHAVTGIDAAPAVIAAARAHAEAAGVAVSYRHVQPAALHEEGARFDAVTALEVIEHVPDPAAFLGDAARLLQPGGRLFVSTINRTLRSLAVAKIGAEYVARLLPRGTHQWRRFVTPAELRAAALPAGLRLAEITGMSFDPLRGRWRMTGDVAVNYLAMLTSE